MGFISLTRWYNLSGRSLKDPRLSQLWFLQQPWDIRQHLILYYCINEPIYLRDRLLISTDRQSCYKLARSLHFFTSSLRTLRAHMLLRKTPDDSTRRRSTFVRLTSCALMAEVGRAPSVLVSRAVINVSMVWSNCRYLQQLGPSVIFSP